ncbi:hypothetical protein [Pseudohongiella sp.]|uniref:DUF2383 domain-containing protein n=1 Tax=marine sediment metagenome TaxID=412755 RepID=A0A0F9Y4Q9_9ZZZZ|nr:hypothetical protein [Pseudohongiella sp.]HDZ10080.1 hypothetical protein [Pseudohongiella sp.]HEA63429.1 hypothetical protein [Pseudohongiella sp.]
MPRVPSYDKVAHLLTILIKFHEKLANMYGRLTAMMDNQYSKLLAEEMQRRELRLVETLTSYQQTAPDRILNTMLQKSYPEDPNEFLGKLEAELKPEAAAGLDPDDFYALGSRADDYIEELLSVLREGTNVPDVRDVFADLQAGEKKERIALSKAYNSLREM